MKFLSDWIKTKNNEYRAFVHILILVWFFNSLLFSQTEFVYSKDNTAVSFISKGRGDVLILFVHGLSIDKSYWSSQMEYFGKKYRAAALDLAGHGESGKSRTEYNVEMYAEDAAAVVKKLNPEKVILVGHSMGGAVIIETAELLKEKTVGLIGVDTYHDLQMKYPQEEIDKFIGDLKLDFNTAMREFTRSMFPPNADSAAFIRVEKDFLKAEPEIVISTLRNVFAYSGEAIIRNLRIPIFAINSDLYPTNTQANKNISDFSVRIIKGTGHFPMIEKAEEFNKLLDEAVQELIGQD